MKQLVCDTDKKTMRPVWVPIVVRYPKRIVRCDSPPRYIYHSPMMDVPESVQAGCVSGTQPDIGNL